MPKNLTGKWAIHYTSCVRCKRTDRRHTSKGLCNACFSLLNYKDNRDKYKSKVRFGGNREKKIALNPNCEFCNSNTEIVVHHKDLDKRNNKIDNFITLCSSCHSKIHNYIRAKEFFGDKINKLISA